MSQGSADAVRVGLVQMCTGRSVEKNLQDVSALVRDAAGQGATYIQTPEITTLMEMDRERLFATIRPQAADPSIPRFADLARELGIWLHIGSMPILLAAGKDSQPLAAVLPARRHRRQLRQDPHVRRRAARRRELPRVEELPARQHRRRRRPAVGQARPHGVLRPALSPPLSRAGQGRRRRARHPLGLHAQNRRGALACAAARPRHRERLLRPGRGAGRPPRERPRDLRPQPDRQSLGRNRRRGRR